MWLLEWNTIGLSNTTINLILFLGVSISILGVGLNALPMKFFPVFKKYNILFQIVGIILLAIGSYLKGSFHSDAQWQLKLLKEQQKNFELERKAVEINNELSKKINEKSKIIYQKGDTIYRYIDKEVIKDKEIIKFVETCPLPKKIIELHNAAATNTPIEESKQ